MYKIIRTTEDVRELKQYIEQHEYLAFDTETTGLNVRKASVIGFSVSGKAGEGYYFPIQEYNTYANLLYISEFFSKAKELLQLLSTKKLVMHNSSFDIRITKNNLGVDLLPALYFDTILGKHTVDEEKPFGLEEIVEKHEKELLIAGESSIEKEGNTLKENIKKNGGSITKDKYEIWKADLDVLGHYAAVDADLTFRLYDFYSKQLKKEGMEKFFYELEVMPLLKEVTIPMEMNGILLDISKLEKTKAEIIIDIERLEDQIQAEIAEKASKVEEELLNKITPFSNKGSFGQAIAEQFGLDLKKSASGKYSLTIKELEKSKSVVTGMTRNAVDYLLGNSTYSLEFGMHLRDIQRRLYLEKTGQRYIINLNSKDQLSSIFFDELNYKPLGKTPTGKPQIDDDFFESIAKECPLARMILEYNKLNKIKSTYIDRFLEEQENGLFYPTFKQHGTISGRYGSDLQQLNRPEDPNDTKLSPTVLKYNNIIREFFIAKPEKIFIDCDYESLEPRIFANDAGDPALISIFETGADMYSTVAIEVFKLHKEFSADKKAPNFLKKHRPELRQQAKAYSLGIRYGMKAWKLMYSIGLVDELHLQTLDRKSQWKYLQEKEAIAQKIIDGYFEAFPNLKKAMDRYLNSAKRFGYVKSDFGRVRHLSEANEIWAKAGDELLDKDKSHVVANRTEWDPSTIKEMRKKLNNLLNNALNFPIQSAAASVVNRAAIAINQEFKKQGIQGQVIAQIHDQLIMEVPVCQAQKACEIVQDKMENTTKLKHLKLVAKPELAKNLKEGH